MTRRVPMPSKEELERMYNDEGMTQYQIAKEFGVGEWTVRKSWLPYYDISTVGHRGVPINGSRVIMPSKDVLERMYNDEGMTQYQIAKEFDVHHATVSIWMSYYNIQARVPMPSKEELERMYNGEGMNQLGIAQEFGVHHATVSIWMYHHGISTVGHQGVPINGSRVPMPSKDVLERMYNDERLSQEQIAKEFDVGQTTVVRWMYRYNIQSRYNVPMPSKDELEKLIGEGLNQLQIAEHFGVSDWKIFDWCERLDIPGMVNGFRFTTPEHRNWRDIVLQRDNYTCQECGEYGGYLNAHHIKPYNAYPELALDPDNGITLCKQCHEDIRGREHKYISKYEDIVLRDRGIGDSFIEHHTIIDLLPGEPPLELNSIIDYPQGVITWKV